MSLIFHVGQERFLMEQQNRRAANKIDQVNWFIKDGIVHMYICTDNETYHYQINFEKISHVVRMLLIPQGQVLGVEYDQVKVEVEQKRVLPFQVNDA